MRHSHTASARIGGRIFCFVLVTSIALSACRAVPTSIALTATPIVTLPTTTAIPTDTATRVAIAAATDAPEPTATRTATPARRASIGASQRATATPSIPPGVYATAIKIAPTPAQSDVPPLFTVTFLNTTGGAKRYRWFVKIYQQDQPQSFGETPKTDSDIPIHTTQLTAVSNWKTTTVVQCLFLIARVFWIDENNQVHEFSKPDGNNPATGFYVCP
jgi:hypothetical protein